MRFPANLRAADSRPTCVHLKKVYTIIMDIYKKPIEELTKYLPDNWEKLAFERKAFTRARNLKTVEDLLALNMLYITNNGSFGLASSMMKLTRGISLNKNAAYKRIAASGEWLRSMAEELCKIQGATIEKPEFLGNKNVKLIDASDEATKEKKTIWRLHYVFDLFNFSCASMMLTTNKTGEKLTLHKASKDDIIIADRIYCTISGIEHVLSNKGDFIIRFKSKAFCLYNKEGERINILDYLRPLKSLENTQIQCFYKSAAGELRPLRIVAMRKDAAAVEKSKRKLEQKASRKQEKEVQPDTAELNEYIVLATSLNYTNEQILELYRARWQVERVFYRLKSLFGYGDVPSENEEAVKAWFYGKLFTAALCERILKTESFSP